MAPPDRQGSLTNSVIWSCTLLAIAALTIWKFDIWPITAVVTNTGFLAPESVAIDAMPVDPITVAGSAGSPGENAVTKKVDQSADDVAPPAELAKLDLAGSLPPLPQPESEEWTAQPPSPDVSSDPERSAATYLPTGANFGGRGPFPAAKQPPSAAPEQLEPVPAGNPNLRPVEEDEPTTDGQDNPFTNAVAAVPETSAASPVDSAMFRSESTGETTQLRLASIDADIEAGRDLAAHRALSQIYWDAPGRRREIQDRIDKTAGRIYFGSEHQYMEAHVVAPGETLSAVARKYKVPAEYLARLNDIDDPASLKPDTKIKVVMGPFAGVIDQSEQALILHAHGYYVRALPGEFTMETVSAGDTLLVVAESGQTITCGSSTTGDSPAIDNPFAEDSPRATVRLSKEDAQLAQDLLAPGATITVRD